MWIYPAAIYLVGLAHRLHGGIPSAWQWLFSLAFVGVAASFHCGGASYSLTQKLVRVSYGISSSSSTFGVIVVLVGQGLLLAERCSLAWVSKSRCLTS